MGRLTDLFADHPVPYPVRMMRGHCVRVIDGDTYWINVDFGFHGSMTVPVRLLGVDTPPLTTEEGRTARQIVVDLLEDQPCMVKTWRDRQSFARWIGEVWFFDETGTQQDLGTYLVANSLAVKV